MSPLDRADLPQIVWRLVEQATDGPRKGLNPPPALRWLLAHGIDVATKRRVWDLNHTALHMTIESGAIEIARLLLDAGADPNVRDDRVHGTALGWAEFFGRDAIAELIRAKGGVQ